MSRSRPGPTPGPGAPARLAASLALAVLAACGGGTAGAKAHADPAARPTAAPTTATTAPATTTTAPATTETTAAPPASTAPTTTAPAPRFTLAPYRGLGAWVDVFDWTRHYDRTPEDPPAVGLAQIDELAARGVRTLFFQPARFDSPEPGLVEEAQGRAIVERARARGMAVVGWYLPTFEDLAFDRAQIDAVLALPLDGFALDIESVRVADEAERNRRAVALAAELRADLPGEVLGAIVLPPVVTEVYGTYWGGFPWEGLAPSVDVWLPMGYWTSRTVESGWRDPRAYTLANIDLLREATGRPDAVVHPVGGIGCCEGPTAPTTVEDVTRFLGAAGERGAIGASLYDVATMAPELWPPMAAANDL